MEKIKKIYFVGIKGVGMASLALIAKEAGFEVSGSDIAEEFITGNILSGAKIKYFSGFSENNFKSFSGVKEEEVLLITTGAHGGFNNIEVKYAWQNGFKILTHGQAVGLFMDGKIFKRQQRGISIAGAHGKTTTTAMLATYLTKLGFDPSYSVGTSEIFPSGWSGHFGKGNFFLAEADEYVSEALFDRQPKFLYQYPEFEIINNIDFDHPDFFKDILQVKKAFSLFIGNLKKNGLIIYNGDDQNLKEAVLENKTVKSLSFGKSAENDIFIDKYRDAGFGSVFEVFRGDICLGEFELSIPGYHNAKNSLGAIAFLIEIGIDIKKIKKVLPLFKGSKRRMEQAGKTRKGALLMDDYAHHPKEIKVTLAAIKSAFPGKKIVCIFQPHTFSRTAALYNDFLTSFDNADYLILLPTFKSARDTETDRGLDKKLQRDFLQLRHDFIFLTDFSSVVEYVNSKFNNQEYLIITMGAGDVYKIISRFKNK